jgi:hypothetical protein
MVVIGCTLACWTSADSNFDDWVTLSYDPIDADVLTAMKVVFRIWVMNSAVTSGRWKVVGQMNLNDDDRKAC